jgi:RNA polymerase sigma-70 factor (ECF subfamily)
MPPTSSYTSTHGFSFDSVIETYQAPLYRFGLSLSRNENDAMDLVQQTFYVWAQKGSALRDHARLKSWLFTTLYREFLKTVRHQKRFVEPPDDDLEAALPAVDSEIASALDGQSALRALQSVDEVYRVPLTLFYLEQMAYRDIAETLNVPIGTIMSRLARGKAQLKKILLENTVSSGNKTATDAS